MKKYRRRRGQDSLAGSTSGVSGGAVDGSFIRTSGAVSASRVKAKPVPGRVADGKGILKNGGRDVDRSGRVRPGRCDDSSGTGDRRSPVVEPRRPDYLRLPSGLL